jgi:DNA-binding MarR family transcriptional regulator
MALEDCHCMSLRKAARGISNFYDAMLAPAGVRATQYSILAVLHQLGGASINDLAARLDLDRTTTGKNMRPLAHAGLIEVVPSPTDGRSRVVQLTPQGAATLAAARPLWQRAQLEFERANGATFSRNLRRTLSALKVNPDPAGPSSARSQGRHS